LREARGRAERDDQALRGRSGGASPEDWRGVSPRCRGRLRPERRAVSGAKNGGMINRPSRPCRTLFMSVQEKTTGAGCAVFPREKENDEAREARGFCGIVRSEVPGGGTEKAGVEWWLCLKTCPATAGPKGKHWELEGVGRRRAGEDAYRFQAMLRAKGWRGQVAGTISKEQRGRRVGRGCLS
jgi:hypothetical protein